MRHFKAIGDTIRKSRRQRGIASLDELANRLSVFGCDKPSTAKLSRIESGIQAVPLDILPALAAVTGIPAARLRPDLAAMLEVA